MSDIATKNGAIVLKDGSVGTNCGCCGEGACCDGTTCSVMRESQCQGTGKIFKGVGTTCIPNPCDPRPCAQQQTGACCLSTEVFCGGIGPFQKCVQVTAQQCEAVGGTFRGVCSFCTTDANGNCELWCNPLP